MHVQQKKEYAFKHNTKKLTAIHIDFYKQIKRITYFQNIIFSYLNNYLQKINNAFKNTILNINLDLQKCSETFFKMNMYH